jgi:hypothetical protein
VFDQIPTVNRRVVFIRPKEPYLAWARALDDNGPSIDHMPMSDLSSVYLIEEDDQQERSLKKHWAEIFEEMLISWCTVNEEWPAQRTYSMFLEWFEVEIQELVFDLAHGPILQEF